MNDRDTTCDEVKKRYKWTEEEKQSYKNLVEWCMREWPTLQRAFVNISKELRRKADQAGYDWNDLVKFERDLASIAGRGNYLEAAVTMATHVKYGVDTYMGGSDDPHYVKMVTELSDFQRRLAPSE